MQLQSGRPYVQDPRLAVAVDDGDGRVQARPEADCAESVARRDDRERVERGSGCRWVQRCVHDERADRPPGIDAADVRPAGLEEHQQLRTQR